MESAERAVALAKSGEVDALMKGSLHTDELMSQVVNKITGIRTARRISHVFRGRRAALSAHPADHRCGDQYPARTG